jgi:hypothetical protein
MLWHLFDLDKLKEPGEGIEHASTSRLYASIRSVQASQFRLDLGCGNTIPELEALVIKCYCPFFLNI